MKFKPNSPAAPVPNTQTNLSFQLNLLPTNQLQLSAILAANKATQAFCYTCCQHTNLLKLSAALLPPKQPQLSVALAINTQTYISSLQPLPQAIGFLPCLLPACRHKLLNLLPSSSMPTIPQQLTDLYAGSTHQRLQKACRMHILLRQLTSQSQYTDHSVRSQRNNVTMEKQHCWYKYMGGGGGGGGGWRTTQK